MIFLFMICPNTYPAAGFISINCRHRLSSVCFLNSPSKHTRTPTPFLPSTGGKTSAACRFASPNFVSKRVCMSLHVCACVCVSITSPATALHMQQTQATPTATNTTLPCRREKSAEERKENITSLCHRPEMWSLPAPPPLLLALLLLLLLLA